MGGFFNNLGPRSFMDPNAPASAQQIQQGVQQQMPGAGSQPSILDILMQLSAPAQQTPTPVQPKPAKKISATDPGTNTPVVGGARKGTYA